MSIKNKQKPSLHNKKTAINFVNSSFFKYKISFIPQIRNFVCCGLMGWDLIRLVMPMAGIELQIAADVHNYPLPHDAA